MKKHWIAMAAVIGLFTTACGTQENTESEEVAVEETAEATDESMEDEEEVSYPYTAGAEFDAGAAISPDELLADLEAFDGDTMYTTLKTNINECCKKKGCWMTLDMGEGNEEMFVRFKDYEFFVPLNADGRETTIAGAVFRDTVSVEQLRHYAEDAGASADSIAKITEPEVKLAFQATGVVVQ
jgi:hypothetical protein